MPLHVEYYSKKSQIFQPGLGHEANSLMKHHSVGRPISCLEIKNSIRNAGFNLNDWLLIIIIIIIII